MRGEIALESSGGFFRHPDAAVAVGHRASLTFRVELPDGYVLERANGFRVAAVVSRYAERVRVTIPVWRQTMVLDRVVDHANNPVAGAVIRGASIPSGDHQFSAVPTDQGGWTRVEGLPALHGETVYVTAGEVATATIHEAIDRWIAGVVRSETGRALATARVSVRVRNGPDIVWLDRGLQRLNPLSGPDGRFAFPGVPPGPAVVHAGYASRLTNAPARDPGVTTVEFGPKK